MSESIQSNFNTPPRYSLCHGIGNKLQHLPISFKALPGQILGKGICNLFVGGDIVQLDFPIMNAFTDIVFRNLNMFGASFLSWIRSEEYGPLIIDIKWNCGKFKLQFGQKIPNPRDLFSHFCHTNIFCFGGRQCNLALSP